MNYISFYRNSFVKNDCDPLSGEKFAGSSTSNKKIWSTGKVKERHAFCPLSLNKCTIFYKILILIPVRLL